MPFDPLAFLKPDKAFSMEGLLSRGMFENFVADDEGSGCRTCRNTKSRLHSLSQYATDRIDEIVDWLNVWECVEITMGQAVLIFNGISQAYYENLDDEYLDDQILTHHEIIGTLNLIREELLNKISGITITNVKNTTDTGTIMYSIYIRCN